MRKILAVLLGLTLVFAAAPVDASGKPAAPQIDLPDGFFPEGIAIGRRSSVYVGSLSDGSIYRGDLKTGAGAVLTEPFGQFGTVGLDVDDHNRVWAAGGPTGTARVYDGDSGELLASYQLTAPLESFINDVIITRDGAWFTDSGTQTPPVPGAFHFVGSPRIFKVPLNRRGTLPDQDAVEELATDVPDVGFPNLNGIETGPNRRGLIVAHTTLGALYRVDSRTGLSEKVAIDAEFVGADGLVRSGRFLYVVENGAARVAKVRLDHSGTEGELRRLLPVEGSETPTTAALYRGAAYVVDARFNSGTGPYQLFRIETR